MPYLGQGCNTVLAKFRGQLAIEYPRKPDGKESQISGGGKMVNNASLANFEANMLFTSVSTQLSMEPMGGFFDNHRENQREEE